MNPLDTLDTSALEKTVQHLAAALKAYDEYRDQPIGEVLRSGVVQSFNICGGAFGRPSREH